MRLKDLHELPKVRDSLSWLYVEHCRIDQHDQAIAIHDAAGTTPIPCASLCVLMLGPGTSITHAAILALADNGCLAAWVGEQGVRFYAAGMGETRKADRLLRQAALCVWRSSRLAVVRRLYELRFGQKIDPSISLAQIRGREGARVRDAYWQASQRTGIPWRGRRYDRGNWAKSDPVNRALSAANACLYGVCHAAIIAAGYSPALGFIHTGKQLSFVYDVADLYKTDLTVPVAFEAAAAGKEPVEREARLRCRNAFARSRLLDRILRDIDYVLSVELPPGDAETDIDADPALPGDLWDPDRGRVAGGRSYATQTQKEDRNGSHDR